MSVVIRSALLFRLEMSLWLLIPIWNLIAKYLAYVKYPFFITAIISRIRKYLSVESAKILVHAFVTCRVDNGNALLYGFPKYLIAKLQSRCSVLCCPFNSMQTELNMTMTMQLLCWSSPVSQRIILKIILLAFKALHGMAPMYISELLDRYVPLRPLRPSSMYGGLNQRMFLFLLLFVAAVVFFLR